MPFSLTIDYNVGLMNSTHDDWPAICILGLQFTRKLHNLYNAVFRNWRRRTCRPGSRVSELEMSWILAGQSGTMVQYTESCDSRHSVWLVLAKCLKEEGNGRFCVSWTTRHCNDWLLVTALPTAPVRSVSLVQSVGVPYRTLTQQIFRLIVLDTS